MSASSFDPEIEKLKDMRPNIEWDLLKKRIPNDDEKFIALFQLAVGEFDDLDKVHKEKGLDLLEKEINKDEPITIDELNSLLTQLESWCTKLNKSHLRHS